MKAQFNYYYNGKAISKSNFESKVEENWLESIDENFNYSYGYYSAGLRTDEITVNPKDFKINEYMSGYYSIKGMLFNTEIEIFGGDSANEDDYNFEYFQEVLENWDGKLVDLKIEL